jgi:hypothetical protein
MSHRNHPFRVLAAVVLLVAACGAEGRSSAILCSTAYRVSPTEALTGTDTMRLTDEDVAQSIPYIYLELHAEYRDGRMDGERALRLWVTPTGEDRVIVSHLFQLAEDAGPDNQFQGDHGFTGLTYAYDPVSGSELQYWCQAD